MSGLGERIPGYVEPSFARQELVGVLPCLEEIHEGVKLCRILRSDVGSLAEKVLRVRYSTNLAIDALVSKAFWIINIKMYPTIENIC